MHAIYIPCYRNIESEAVRDYFVRAFLMYQNMRWKQTKKHVSLLYRISGTNSHIKRDLVQQRHMNSAQSQAITISF
jgi:hypothetical protein